MFKIEYTARHAYGTLDGEPWVHYSREYETRAECEHRLKTAPTSGEHTAKIIAA